MARRHWSTLPGIHSGFTRAPDNARTGQRMCRCKTCGHYLPTLGIGYHLNAVDCTVTYPDGWTEPSPDRSRGLT